MPRPSSVHRPPSPRPPTCLVPSPCLQPNFKKLSKIIFRQTQIEAVVERGGLDGEGFSSKLSNWTKFENFELLFFFPCVEVEATLHFNENFLSSIHFLLKMSKFHNLLFMYFPAFFCLYFQGLGASRTQWMFWTSHVHITFWQQLYFSGQMKKIKSGRRAAYGNLAPKRQQSFQGQKILWGAPNNDSGKINPRFCVLAIL